MNKSSNILYSATGDRAQDEKLLQPFTYSLQASREEFFVKLIKAFNIWLKISEDKMSIVMEIIHNLRMISLLVDDVEDNSVLRRGMPVAHSIYGVASTINAAYYAYFILIEKVLKLNNLDAINVFIQQSLELHRGQGIEIYWRDSFICPSEEEYKQMTISKTGAMFMLALKLMQLFSNNKSDFSKFVGILGYYVQICNDYSSLCNRDPENYVSYEDITDGIFTFPIIHAIRTQPNDSQVMRILQKKTKDVCVKKYCISLLEKFGSFKYTNDTINLVDKEAREEIQKLGDNSEMEKILDELFMSRATLR